MQDSRPPIIVILVAISLLIVGVAVGYPTVMEGLVWRLEKVHPMPGYSQRLLERRMEQGYEAWDALADKDAILIIGDSHLYAIPSILMPGAINLSIGGQSISRIAKRMARMKSLKKVKQVVIGGGYNDLVEGRKLSEISHSWREALSVVPEPVKIVCVGIPSGRGALPSRADDISKLNQMLREICELRKSKFLYAGTENPAFSGVDAFSQDGIHLVPEATRILANLVKVALE